MAMESIPWAVTTTTTDEEEDTDSTTMLLDFEDLEYSNYRDSQYSSYTSVKNVVDDDVSARRRLESSLTNTLSSLSVGESNRQLEEDGDNEDEYEEEEDEDEQEGGQEMNHGRTKTVKNNEKDDENNTHDHHGHNESSSSSNDSFHGIQSRPKPDGTGAWNPTNPLHWCASFGTRSMANTQRLASLVRLRPGDEGYYDTLTYENCIPPGVSVVRTPEQAQIVLESLRLSKITDPTCVHACDTEVMDIDLAKVGPVGNGYVTCMSVYSGPDFDYGLGDGPGTMLWIDNLDDSAGLLNTYFTNWLQDTDVLKIWHNYGFDRHVLYNEGINVQGFGGDTLHMARLCDTSRMKYSLESLTEDLLHERKVPMKEIFGQARPRKDGTPGALIDLPPMERLQRDPNTRTNWILYSAKDAKSTYDLYQHLKVKLQSTPWINDYNLMEYYHMHMRPFGELLTDLERRGMLIATNYLADVEIQARKDRTEHEKTFRKWAAEQIGPDGLAMNLASSVQLTTFLFGGAMNSKTKERSETVRIFKTAREEIPDDAMEAYRWRNARVKEDQDGRILTTADGGGGGDGGSSTELIGEDDFDLMKADQLKLLCKEYGLKVSGKKAELQQRLRGHFQLLDSGDISNLSPRGAKNNVDDYDSMSVNDLRDTCRVRGVEATGKKSALVKALREDDAYSREITAAHMSSSPSSSNTDLSYTATHRKISELLEEAAASGENDALKTILDGIKAKNMEEPKYVDIKITSIGMEPDTFTTSGAPSATSDVLRKLAGDPFADPPVYGKAYDFFGGGQQGHDACVAFYSLTAIGSIDTMIANFLTSLQTLADDQQRVHGSLNINTETGRLSSRKPNLQNQPALEKDKYKIRQAFIASPGNKLIVADYGQLELRLLASMTDCTSMIEAFEAGGDFHSRTALGMFKYIQDAVENGDCLLEWDYSNGDEPNKPMLKDKYASERRKAKTLNFSIAYGKTAHGLSQDWGVSPKEAEEMLQAWYKSRPEVEKWQKNTKEVAKKYGITRTLMGRYRHLPHAKDNNSMKSLGHALRASINTPIQGGAADVAMMAMLKINNSELLKRLGWILLMQVHDEVILEGPEETAEEAFREVLQCMQEPWVLGLEKTKVPLLVDGSYAHTNWYDAK
jgi:DNA polymerase I-like protein with 3'-5' exonuclease and polymerase domains